MGARYLDGIRALRGQRCFDNRGLNYWVLQDFIGHGTGEKLRTKAF